MASNLVEKTTLKKAIDESFGLVRYGMCSNAVLLAIRRTYEIRAAVGGVSSGGSGFGGGGLFGSSGGAEKAGGLFGGSSSSTALAPAGKLSFVAATSGDGSPTSGAPFGDIGSLHRSEKSAGSVGAKGGEKSGGVLGASSGGGSGGEKAGGLFGGGSQSGTYYSGRV